MTPTEIIGHRGFSAQAPENTLEAMTAALEAGADAVEWDLHVTACRTPVLIHDDTLDRTTTGRGPVAARTLAELREVDAGSWFHPRFRGAAIPTFAEALEEMRPYGAGVYAEVKGIHDTADLALLSRIVRDQGMESRTAFISLDFQIADGLAGMATGCRVGYVVSRHAQFQDALRRSRSLGPRGLLDLRHTMVLEDPLLVPRARAQGVDIAVWTVDELEEAEGLLSAGVRRFTTNQVARLVEWRRGASAG